MNLVIPSSFLLDRRDCLPQARLQHVCILSLCLMGSALSNIYVQYQSRHAFSAWNHQVVLTHKMQSVYQQLSLEKAALLAPIALWDHAKKQNMLPFKLRVRKGKV